MRLSTQKARILLFQALSLALTLGKGAVAAESSAPAAAESPSAAPFNAAIPEGKTLPANVARFRLVHKSYEASSGFNDRGLVTDLGLQYRGSVTAIVGEVGISDRLSFRVMAPYFYRNSARLDQDKFKQSALFKSKYKEKIELAAAELRKTKLCHNTEQCLAFIERGESLPFSRDVYLDTGEHFTLTAGTPIKDAISARILAAATPPHEGPLGLGDIEAGLLYNVYRSERLLFSTGLGFRFPTGTFDVPEVSRPTSGGVTDLGLRLNLDLALSSYLWLSMQEQVEQALTKATWRRGSELDNSRFNLADPMAGDGERNQRVYEKRGLTLDSLVKANYGLSGIDPSLKALAMNVSYQHKKDRAVYLDKQEHKKAAYLQWIGMGAVASGLAYKLPLELEVQHALPLTGRDARLAPTMTETTLRVYTRF